jgi:hypothetical protein
MEDLFVPSDIRNLNQTEKDLQLVAISLTTQVTSAPARTANLTTSKIVFNDVVSMLNAKAMFTDINNFYLNTPLDHPEYMKLPIALIPDEIIEEYDLLSIMYTKEWYSCKLTGACMAYLRLESFPTSSSPDICPNMDTTLCQTCPASGPTLATQYSCHWLSTILQSSTLEKNMWTIFQLPSVSTTKFQLIGDATYSAESNLIGTMRTKPSTCPCLVTLKPSCTSTNTQNQNALRMHCNHMTRPQYGKIQYTDALNEMLCLLPNEAK